MADMTTSTCIKLGRAAAIPWGQGRCYVVGGREIAVFRQRDGRLYAVENRCPHKKGPLAEGLVGGGKVICPLHAHQFDLSTGKGSEGAECVRTFSVAETEGNLMLNVEVEGIR
jgi:nitrite reductase (NADH) small subunit